MSGINWNILAQAPDVAAAVQQGFQAAQQMKQQAFQQNALMQRQQFEMQDRQTQQQEALRQQQAEAAKQQRETVGRLAKVAKTPETWDAAIDHLVAQGMPDAAQYKGKFSPELRAATMAAAGIDDKDDDPTSMQRNYEWLKSQNPTLAESYIRGQAEGPPMVVDNGDGTKTIYPRSHFGGGAPGPAAAPAAAATDPASLQAQAEAAIAAGADPVAVNARLQQMLGGAGQGGPRTFP